MALRFLEGAAKEGFAAANALIGKVFMTCSNNTHTCTSSTDGRLLLLNGTCVLLLMGEFGPQMWVVRANLEGGGGVL